MVVKNFKSRMFIIPCLLLLLMFISKNLLDKRQGPLSKVMEILVHSTSTSKPTNPDVIKHLHHYDPARVTNLSVVISSDSEYARRQEYVVSKTISTYVINRLNNKTGGFFVEAGAYDGLVLSNTLKLERTYGWTGLLVEPDPEFYPILINRNRKVIVADVCLSVTNETMKVTMGGYGKTTISFIENDFDPDSKLFKAQRHFQAQCIPLHMLLDEIGRNYVDYLSLDIEGVEWFVLQTIPWDRIRIKIISVEYRPGSRDIMKTYLESKGYQRVNSIAVGFSHDDVYELIE